MTAQLTGTPRPKVLINKVKEKGVLPTSCRSA